MSWIFIPFEVLAIALALSVLVLFVEILAGCLHEKWHVPVRGERPRVVVLIPAHNEGLGITPTINDIRPQLRPGDRLLVIADNCNDDTAEVALANGAEVIRRNDTRNRGKGFALDFGLRGLAMEDPDIVIVIDADCRVDSRAIDVLASVCAATRRPVQARYLMSAPAGATVNHQIAEFAWRIKNDLRPRGLHAFGLPCQLMGSGMAFPRRALESVKVASGHLTEDLELGLLLASSGQAPLFCPAAHVTSVFPLTKDAARSQRQRWEHGHLAILIKRVCPMIGRALIERDVDLLALSLDVAVPPTVLLILLTMVVTMVNGTAAVLGGGWVGVYVGCATLFALVAAILMAWNARGRDLITRSSLRAIGPYLAAKAGIYVRAFAREKAWVRTTRGGGHG
ncbi:glycosyltransferase family 2 protein [Bradyrhizobium sp. STM 3809]|uniref:glycosyltransferase family 2 protein n=1 Tax=Bradyrhizobium sp. STM 3809 TaxID=551936 RepID=UPI0002409D07|nr:glycosyltransferase family 2 protein [Bradyrhizobium sp. STM 3809]CCE01580.1 putative Glycosyl transferase, family 2 [Bradyrhizobium sp. STM 3809]